jgi:hypothetical protein
MATAGAIGACASSWSLLAKFMVHNTAFLHVSSEKTVWAAQDR